MLPTTNKFSSGNENYRFLSILKDMQTTPSWSRKTLLLGGIAKLHQGLYFQTENLYQAGLHGIDNNTKTTKKPPPNI
jgi:hypothetical protein